MQFHAEVMSYQIVNRADGKVAVIKLEIPESIVPDSYFLGGLVQQFMSFEVKEPDVRPKKPILE
jgi:hypothetical protein